MNNLTKDEFKAKSRKQIMGGMGVGIALGLALGAAMGNIVLGLILGIMVGGIGVAIQRRRQL